MLTTRLRRLAKFFVKLLSPLSDAGEHWAVGLGAQPQPRARRAREPVETGA